MENENKQGGTSTLIKIAFRNIWRNKRRTAFCFAAVGLAVFFIVFYQSFIQGMTGNIDDVVQIFELGHVNVVSSQFEAEREYMPVWHPAADGRDWREMADLIQEIPGVTAVFPRITAFATLRESVVKHATLWGLNIQDEMAVNNFNLSRRGDGLLEGNWPAPDSNEVAIGTGFARRTGLGIGDRISLRTMSAQFSDRFWSPVITGIFEFEYIRYDEQIILADFRRLARLLALDEGTQQLIIFTEDAGKSRTVAAAVEKLLGEGNAVEAWQDSYWVAIMRAAVPIYTIMFLVFIIVASFLIVNTMMMVVHERIKEIGMMGSLGMTRREIVTVFSFESFFLAAFGALMGVTLGGILSFIGSQNPLRFEDLYGNMFSDLPMGAFFMHFSFDNLAGAWFFGVIIASLFTLIPSLKSARVEPVEALRR